MPRPPDGVLERLNYIADFFFDPCDAPLTIYAETMLPALIEAAILWYAPVPDEIFTAWARPTKAMGRMRSGKKGRRGSKAGKWGKNSKLLKVINFDTNEFIGKRLPGAEKLGEASLRFGAFNLWRIFSFIQFFGLIWLVWEVVSGFFARWFSLLYETEYCRATTSAILDSYDNGYIISNIVGDNGFLALTIRKQRGPISVIPGGFSTIASNPLAVVGVEILGDPPEGAWVEVVFWRGGSGTGTIESIQRRQVGPEFSRTQGFNFKPRHSGTTGISLRTNAGLLFISTTLYVQAGARSN